VDFLLAVNVLIARADSRHEHHRRCRRWEEEHADASLCTCPLTENGFLCIYGHPGYPGGPGSPGEALVELRHLLAFPHHRFLPADVTVAHGPTFGDLREVSPKQLADLYLLAVASRNGVQFATLDESVPAARVAGGPAALHVIPPGGA
jgi:hypothetical protein